MTAYRVTSQRKVYKWPNDSDWHWGNPRGPDYGDMRRGVLLYISTIGIDDPANQDDLVIVESDFALYQDKRWRVSEIHPHCIILKRRKE
jgi:hypothetical protein